ncbi:heterokaryon incompatibility protein-domain-containing protein [Annulohypoxylon bovei var. microspora]|nr:heterokaryon incompatibility protein-domain-containing protein [Annulohypoxylon bovei var. microspora]
MADFLTYNHLPLGHIRLLNVNSDKPGVFSGHLKTVPLDDAPSYFALSYRWEKDKQDVPIHIDGMPLLIGPSLADALRRLAELGAQETGLNQDIHVKWAWIDRICINQDDIQERSRQVHYMGSIYARAVRTLIWLEPDFETLLAWQLISQIYDIFRKENSYAKCITDIPFRMYSDEHHAALGLPGWHDSSWQSLRRLFRQSWFTRVWIIQEVVLSREDPVIFCGLFRYPWDRLAWAASWMRRNGYLRLPQIPNEIQNVDTIANIRRCPDLWRLDALLVTTSVKCHATDPRDKVYALLGLAMESKAPNGIPHDLMPDYRLEVWQVYTNVAKFLLQEYKTLSSLTRTTGVIGDKSRAQRQQEFEQLPSWVPNWCDFTVVERVVMKSLSWVPFSGRTEIQALGFPRLYNASAGLCAKFADSVDPTMLRLLGLQADVVVNAIPPSSELQSNGLHLCEECEQGPQMLSILNAAISTLSGEMATEWIGSYIKATTTEQYDLGGTTEEQMLKDGSAYLLRVFSRYAAQDISPIPPNDFQELIRTLRLMSFFITTSGKMGIGPSSTLVGDRVAVILGGGVPYILRAEGSSYVFVGESFVHGLMDGEAIRAWRKGELFEETIELH